MPAHRRSMLVPGLAMLGLAGSLLAAVAAPRALEDRIAGWWYPQVATSRATATLLVWAGMILLALAWLAVLRLGPDRRTALVLAALWVIPLALAPPLFSRDVYSYLAQGAILHLGHDPYHQPSVVLKTLGDGHLLSAVSPFWRHTTAPYGPLFLWIVGIISTVGAAHLVAGVLLCRALDLVGLALLALWIPRLSDALGADGGRATWLVLASPLTLLTLVAPAHNDLLMAGLLAAGAGYALRGRPLLGIAVCALAATIKIPALTGAAFIAVAWARAEVDPRRRVTLLATAAAITIAVLGVVTLITGVGVGWLSSGVFSTPAMVHLAITPGTALGYTVALILRAIGISVSTRPLEDVFGVVMSAFAFAGMLWLLWRVRVPRAIVLLGAALVLAAIGGPAAWPWYLCWGLVLLAACPGPQRSPWFTAAVVLGAFAVRPDGVLSLSIGSAPVVLGVYIVAAALAWMRQRRGGERTGSSSTKRAMISALRG